MDRPSMEKEEVDRVSSADSLPVEQGFDKKAEKKLLRKIDIHLLPFLTLLYLLSFLDRSNIGNARLAGLEEDLNMSGLDYNNALAVFFPFYVASEIPSNIMMKRTRPSLWIPSIMLAWGLVCTLMGVVQNYPGLMAARAALGFAEGGLFPGVTFFISMWYKRFECGARVAFFFSAATIAGAFGGLLARAIMFMDGTAGQRAWRWIFILEGIATFLIGIAAFWALYDYPTTAKFLTKTERKEVERRLESDRSGLDEAFSWTYFWDALKDWKIWVNCIITISIFTPLYSFSLFMPTIMRELGYQNEKAQLMTVPPYVVACLICLGFGLIADRVQQRGVFQIAFAFVSMAGFLMLLISTSKNVKYGATFLATIGIYTNVPLCVVWTSNNVGGSTKRSIGVAMQVGMGNLGGILASYTYLPDMAPLFRTGHAINVALTVATVVLSTFMTVYFRHENARRDREHKRPEEYTLEEKQAEKTRGDRASFFRYCY